MITRFLQIVGTGSLGLILAANTLAGHSTSERTQVSPACHPTFGYHQTCWRRFPPLPPCENTDHCPTCQDQATCQDGSCQPPVYQPAWSDNSTSGQPVPAPHTMTGPITQPHMMESGQRYGGLAAPASIYPNHISGGPTESVSPVPPVPAPGLTPDTSRYGTTAPAAPPATTAPMTIPANPIPQGHSGPSSRYSAPAVPSMPAPSTAPAVLPPLPAPPSPQATQLRIPLQSAIQPGHSRYRGAPSAPQVPTYTNTHTVGMPRSVQAQPPAAPTGYGSQPIQQFGGHGRYGTPRRPSPQPAYPIVTPARRTSAPRNLPAPVATLQQPVLDSAIQYRMPVRPVSTSSQATPLIRTH